ncbi:MAG TPA: hypothetical protein VFF68_07025, partial [Anaerolineaceae bacterium]|nr:hypothetical protein [Anaerolineaceae bacterium]
MGTVYRSLFTVTCFLLLIGLAACSPPQWGGGGAGAVVPPSPAPALTRQTLTPTALTSPEPLPTATPTQAAVRLPAQLPT